MKENYKWGRSGTLVNLLRFRAIDNPGGIAYTFLHNNEKEFITYGDLDKKARMIAACLQDDGAYRQPVLLLFQPGIEYICSFFGCLYAGAYAVPTYLPKLNRVDDRLISIVMDTGTKLALVDMSVVNNKTKIVKNNPEIAKLKWILEEQFSKYSFSEWNMPSIEGEHIAFLQYTSGSTKRPRGVMVTHSNLLHNSEAIRVNFGQSEKSKGVIWLPPYHDMGLIGGIIQPLYSGYEMVLMSPFSFIENPIRWLEAITEYRATVSGGPDFAYELCARKINEEQKQSLSLENWEVAFNGSEPIKYQSMKNFYEQFKSCGFRWEAFHPCYGLAEATLLVSGAGTGQEPYICDFERQGLEIGCVNEAVNGENVKKLVSSGIKNEEDRIVIVNPETMCVETEKIGEVWIKGPGIAKGYWNNEDETEKVFHAYLKDTGEGPFMRTGDLGFFVGNQLFINGRIRDLIIIRGKNYYPQDIEATVEQNLSVLRGGSTAVFTIEKDSENKLVVVAEIERSARNVDVGPVVEAIRKMVSEGHGVSVYAAVILKPYGMPKTSSGKVQRSLCKKMYLEGTLDTMCIHTLEDDNGTSEIQSDPAESSLILRMIHELQDMESRKKVLSLYLQEVCSRLLNVRMPDIDVDKPLTGLGADSLTGLEIANEINKNLHIRISVSNMLDGASIKEISKDILNDMEKGRNSTDIIKSSITSCEGRHALSNGQRAMWFLHELTGGGLAYHIAKAVKTYGDLDIPVLERSFSVLAQRHPMLRTVFSVQEGEPVQIIKNNPKIDFLYEEAIGLKDDAVGERLGVYSNNSFDLSKGPLFRVNVMKTANEEYVLLFVIHHIISDFWSIVHMMRELEDIYGALEMGAEICLPQLKHDYMDYLDWSLNFLDGSSGEELKNYWTDKLKGASFVLNLPIDHKRPPVQTYKGAAVYRQADASMNEKLREFARKQNVTLYTVLAAAYQILLYRFTGQRDILIGTPASGRTRAEFNDICGYFVNPLVLRGCIENNQLFSEFLEEFRKTVAEAFEHQDLPFNLLVEMLAPERDLSRPPVVQTFFTLLKSPTKEYQHLADLSMRNGSSKIFGFDARSVGIENTQAQFELSLSASDTGSALGFSMEYNADLFSGNTAERLLAYYLKILDEVMINPNADIDRIEILPSKEKEMILYEWNENHSDYPQDRCIHELIEEMVLKNPDKTAVFFKEEKVTYRELDNMANQIAGLLIKNKVKPGDAVAICMERSIEMVASLLAVFKAGAYYIPVDPLFPSERIEYIIEDSEVSTVLLRSTPSSDNDIMEKIKHKGSKILVLEEMGILSLEDAQKPCIKTSSQDLAYVIYTSGSTGKPKGVKLRHQGVVNFLYSMMKEPGINENDRLLAVTTLSFDISVLELFLPLCSGATIVIADKDIAADGISLAKCIEMNDITIMQATPSTYKIISDTGWKGNGKLKILCGGEPLPSELVKRLLEMGTSVYNMCGPTETTVWSSVYRIRDGNEAIYVGKPIANTVMYILDSNLNPLPIGAIGELYIGGDGVALGYLKRPELTSERFVRNPFDAQKNSIIYKTGDLARYRACGNIELLGRLDNQIKVRGHRIEPGEIEAVLGEHPDIRETVVIAVKFDDGDLRLVAYVVYDSSMRVSTKELREFLKNKLPEYMIPSFFVALDSIPLLPNGKINRNALPQVKEMISNVGTGYEKAKNSLEFSVAEIWKNVLEIKNLGMNDNFFDAGGHSLLMSKIHSKLVEAGICGKDVSIVEMFQYSTVRSFCSYVADRANTDLDSLRMEQRKDRELSSNQQRDLRRISRMKR